MIPTDSMEKNLLSSPDVNLMNSLSSEWYQNVLQDSFELQMKIAVQMERRIRASSSTDSFHSVSTTPLSVDSFESTDFSQPIIPTASLAEISGEDRGKSTFSIRGRRYKSNNLLAQICSQVLQRTASPRPAEINDIVRQLQERDRSLSGEGEKKLKSQVREWFRKRREYLAAKIYRSCDRLLPRMPAEVDKRAFSAEVCTNETVVGLIAVEARLPMDSEDQKRAFVKEKICDYYLSYPKRRLRNSLGIQMQQDPSDEEFILSDLMN